MIKSLFMVAPLLFAAGATAQQSFQASNNKPMPQFIITTIDGHKLTNQSLKGKTVLFDFWATWCGPCKMASPAMQKLYATFKDKGVVVIGADTFENAPGPRGAKDYKEEHKFKYLFTYENDGLAHSLGIQSIPAFVLMDRHGVIRDTKMGVPSNGGADALYSYFAKRINHLK